MAGKPPSKSNGSNGGSSVPARQVENSSETPDDEIKMTTPAQTPPDEDCTLSSGTDDNQNKQPLTKADLSNKIKLIQVEIDTTSKVINLIRKMCTGHHPHPPHSASPPPHLVSRR